MKRQRSSGPTTTTSLILVFIMTAAAASKAAASPRQGPFHSNAIRNWIDARCGGQGGSAVWVYEGALYDPLDGRKIANVEGLELVRHVADYEHGGGTADSFQKRCGDLKFPNWFSRQQSLSTEDDASLYATTILSRKLFCYQFPQQKQDQPRRLLDSIRLRPNAPLRKIPTDQAMAVYDAATTFLSRDNGNELIVHTEAPNGKCLWARATRTTGESSSSHSPTNTLDFTVLARRRVKKDFPDLAESSEQSKGNHHNAGGVTVAPKRSKLVQFGGGSPQSSKQNRLGARETYSYVMEPSQATPHRSFSLRRLLTDWQRRRRANEANNMAVPSCRVRYMRHGEGPPWYGPGKFCTLEIEGRRVRSLNEAPIMLTGVAATRLPGFLSVHHPIPRHNDDETEGSNEAALQAIRWFRQGILQIEQEDGYNSSAPRGALQRMARRLQTGGAALFQRLRAASSLSPSDESTPTAL